MKKSIFIIFFTIITCAHGMDRPKKVIKGNLYIMPNQSVKADKKSSKQLSTLLNLEIPEDEPLIRVNVFSKGITYDDFCINKEILIKETNGKSCSWDTDRCNQLSTLFPSYLPASLLKDKKEQSILELTLENKTIQLTCYQYFNDFDTPFEEALEQEINSMEDK